MTTPLDGRLRARSADASASIRRAFAGCSDRFPDMDDDERAHLSAVVDASVAASLDLLTHRGPASPGFVNLCREVAATAARRRLPPEEVSAYPELLATALLAVYWAQAAPGDHLELSSYTGQVHAFVTIVQTQMRHAYAEQLDRDGRTDSPGAQTPRRGESTRTAPPAGPPPPCGEALESRLRNDIATVTALRRVMAPLREEAELVRTLRCLYRCDLDRTRTARELGIARRTLVYRLDRIQQLTGTHPTATRGVQVLGPGLAVIRAGR